MTIHTKVAAGAALVAALSLAACSTSSGGSSPNATGTAVGGTLTITYSSTFKPAVQPVVKAFEAKYPGTKVDIKFVGGDYDSLISTQIQGGTVSDVFLSQPGHGGPTTVQTLAAQNKLLDLSAAPWVPSIPKLWASDMSYKGKTYAYPGTLQGLGAAYNQTRLKELGLEMPKTWSQVLALCQSAKQKGVYAYAQPLNEAAGPQMVYLALSASLIYGPNPGFSQQLHDKKVTLKTSPWRQVLQQYKQMKDAGCFGSGFMGRNQAQAINDTASGKALGMVTVGAVLAPLKQAAPKSDFTIVTMPATDDPNNNYFAALPGWTVSVNAKAKNPAAAKAFINLLAEPEQINAYATGFASVPLIPNNTFKAPAPLAAFNEAVAAHKSAKIADWPNPRVNEVAQQGVQAIFLGKDSVDGVLQKMQDAYGN